MFYNEELWIIGIIFAVIVGIGIAIAQSDSKHQKDFMDQCVQDHKQYECDAMWRAGEDHTTVMPIPVFIGK